jgi:ABC-type transport system involved in multi-copper enzyme maturation permease subunit
MRTVGSGSQVTPPLTRPAPFFTEIEVDRTPWWEILLRKVAVLAILTSTLVLLVVSCIFLVIVANLSQWLLLPFGVFALVVVDFNVIVWSIAYQIAPEPTKLGGMLLVLLLMLLTPLPSWILRAREQARINQCMHNLRELHSGIEHWNQTPVGGEQQFGTKYSLTNLNDELTH